MTRVAQALDVVAGHDELHGREERADELRLLVADGLPDALRHRDQERFSSSVTTAMPLTYSTTSGRLVCWPSTVTSSATAKWLACGFVPVDEPDRLVLLAHARA